MNPQTQAEAPAPHILPGYDSILLAVDSSDHSNRGVEEAVVLGGIWKARITAVHVYAAKLHDLRFRQMEGGLPERYRAEQELERQREVHDDLITRGLSIITDSYLDRAQRRIEGCGLGFRRRSLEGKNYRELTREVNGGTYDLLVMGALGLGRVEGSRLGTVCRRLARRSAVDTLIVKEPERGIARGPIVVAVDGSAKSYGGLLSALALAREWGVAVKVVSAFDPYYHYVAFNRIAGVLSEEAGKVFRFREQERLHEEIIDSGLAKIYQGHLAVSRSVAADFGMEVEGVLLDGKPHEVILRYLNKVKPSLLVLGKTGIHADPDLDIGGNAEQLLHDADCAVLLSQRGHQPEVERLAGVTTSWTEEAEARMQRVPSFARSMARMAILRYAREQGHTVVTERIVEEATARLMPGHAEQAMEEIVAAHDAGELGAGPKATLSPMRWSDAATSRLLEVKDLSLRGSLSMRAEKKARVEGSGTVEEAHILAFLQEGAEPESKGACPFAASARSADPPAEPETAADKPTWSVAAEGRLLGVPAGFCREMTRKAAETIAVKNGVREIDSAFMGGVMETFEKGSMAVAEELPWDPDARARIRRAPEMVQGMLVREIEGYVRRNGMQRVGHRAVDAVKAQWESREMFHLDPSDPRSGMESAADLHWQAAALARLMRVPAGFMRDSSKQRIEEHARARGQREITLETAEEGLAKAREAMEEAMKKP